LVWLRYQAAVVAAGAEDPVAVVFTGPATSAVFLIESIGTLSLL